MLPRMLPRDPPLDRLRYASPGRAGVREQFEDERDSKPARLRALESLPNGAEPRGEGSDVADDDGHRRDLQHAPTKTAAVKAAR